MAAPASDTRWIVRGSEGADAIAFLGPLSGRPLYTKHYPDDAVEFAERLGPSVAAEIASLWDEATSAGISLLGPSLQVAFSGVGDLNLDGVIDALRDREDRLRPGLEASPYWQEETWRWLDTNAGRVDRVLSALRAADFVGYRRSRVVGLDDRIAEVSGELDTYDVVGWQRKLTGIPLRSEIEIVLLYFSKPHGIKVQGQRFLQSMDYDIPTTVRIAAHEMLHPPIDMEGSIARTALSVLEDDPLIMRIVHEHDPSFGYTTPEGLFNEDICQALDQLIAEELGVARDPSERWRTSDDGIHVMAAALYGYLTEDRWVESGGSIEDWIADALGNGRFAAGPLQHAASTVLGVPVDRLWPVGS